MQRVQRLVGAVLVLGLLAASGVAFAVAQGLKSDLPFVSTADFSRAAAFSPGCDCPTDRARFTVTVSRVGAVEIWVVSASGRRVRTLLDAASRTGTLTVAWDGKTDSGEQARDGVYRIRARVGPSHSLTFAQPITLDTRGPRVRASLPTGTVVRRSAGDAYRFSVVADENASVRAVIYAVAGDGAVARVWRSPEPVAVTADRPVDLTWPVQRDGSGEPAAIGTYLVGYEAIDAAGNATRSPTRFAAGATGDAGVVRVRGVEITPTGRIATAAPTARVRLLRLVDGLAGSTVTEVAGPPASLATPRPSVSGLYALEVYAGDDRTWGFAADAGAARVVVIVPTYTWQADNPYDADTDGFPDVAPAPQGLDRPLGDDGRRRLGAMLATGGPILRAARGFGAITDADFEDLGAPRSARMLVVVGASVWTPGLIERLRTFVDRGGRLALIASPLDRTAERREASLLVAPGVRAATVAGRRVTTSVRVAERLAARLTRSRARRAP